MTERRPSAPRSSARPTADRSARPGSRPGHPGQRGARPVSGARPDARRVTAEPAPRPRLTGRAAILILVIAVLTVSYASSMRAYLQLRDQIEGLKAKNAAYTASIDDMEREIRRHRDPAFIEAQARERFDFVMPGESSYRVIDENGQPMDSEEALSDPDALAANQPPPWWDTVWGTVELAGKPPAATPPPASRLDGSESAQ